MKKLKPKTVKLLRRVQEEILKEPRRLNMHRWFSLSDNVAPCRTTACIAGYTLALSNGKGSWKSAVREAFSDEPDTAMAAMEKLGITEEQANRLFYATNRVPDYGWPKIFTDAYRAAREQRNYLIAAEIAVARIDHFIRTGGKE